MTTAAHPFADWVSFVQRSQFAANDAIDTWIAIVHAINEASGSHAKNMRQVVHGMFDLIEQGFTVEREIAKYLTIASRVAATTADSSRDLTDLALGTVEAATRVAARSH